MFAAIPELAAHAAATANGVTVGMFVEGIDDIRSQFDQGHARVEAGDLRGGLAAFIVVWDMLEARLPRMLAVQAECTRLRLLAAERMRGLPAAERTARLRGNDEEQARIDGRVTEMQGTRRGLEDIFVSLEHVVDSWPEFQRVVDAIKQRRSVGV